MILIKSEPLIIGCLNTNRLYKIRINNMKKTIDELHNELMNKLRRFTDDIGIHLPPDKIPDTTKSLIELFITYEKYRDSIIFKGKRTLEKGIGQLPIEKQKEFESKVKEYCER
tara:strand:- start:172 stop:510 length:339 start_codon:yes stop_codon:yes gene_type:complete